MRVSRQDGCCRSCGGTLDITDVDDVTMSVECQECGDSYEVETDAFGDGCMTYWAEMMLRRQEEGGDDE